MKPVRIFVFLMLIIGINKTYAQKDYVITPKRDTIFCDIKMNVISGRLKYRPKGKGSYILISNKNVIEYFTAADTSTYVLKSLKAKEGQTSVFLNWIEKGKINLYEQQVDIGSQSGEASFWYASKGNDSLRLIKVSGVAAEDLGRGIDREKVFVDMIADFPPLLEDFEKKSYTFSNIEDCVIMYNSRFLTFNKAGQ